VPSAPASTPHVPPANAAHCRRPLGRRRFLALLALGGLSVALVTTDLGAVATDAVAELVLLLPPVGNPESISAETGHEPPLATETGTPLLTSSAPTTGAVAAVSSPTATPTAARAAPISLFDTFLQPLFEATQQRRRQRQEAEGTAYGHRLDPTLNADRLNFLLYGYGVSNEASGPDRIGTHTILSYHLQAHKIDLISLTHDIRAPEIERYAAARGNLLKATKMHLAYQTGGFDLQRLVLEDATGLSVDFQLNMDDVFVKRFVETTCGRIQIDNPAEFTSQRFYLEGSWYEGKRFPKGWLTLDGFETLRYMKTLPESYNPRIERNVRKHLVLQALLHSIEGNYRNPLWLLKVAALLRSEARAGRLTADFAMDSLVLQSLATMANTIRVQGLSSSTGHSLLPRVDRTLYVVYIDNGDGGVRWVGVDALFNPVTKAELAQGVYGEESVAVPYFADAHQPDLITHYWPSVRNLVRRTLLPPPSRRRTE